MLHGKFSPRSPAVLMSIIVGVGTAGVVLAPPAAAAVVVEQYVEVPQCAPATGQDCPQTPKVSFSVAQTTRLRASFTGNANGCSEMFVRISVDNYPQTDWLRVGPSQTVVAPGTFDRSGDHLLGVTARGIEGGCNTGILNSWGGTVRLESEDSAPTPDPSRIQLPFEIPFQIQP